MLAHHLLIGVLAPGAESGSVLEKDKGDWDHGGGEEAEEAKGPGAGETGDHWFWLAGFG